MLYLLGFILLLVLLFALAFAVLEKWEQVRGGIIIRLSILVITVGAAAYGARYWVITAVTCLPNCAGANLVNRDLSRARLNGADFIGANLNGSNLSGTQLRGANLSGAQLARVNLEGADLRSALLLGVNLRNANLAGALLAGTDLNGSDLTNADLTGVDLSETSLLGVTLENAELESVDLTGVNLTAVYLVDAKMNGARLVNANLSGASLSRVDLSGAQLSGSNLSGAWLNLATLIGADLTNADLSGASLIGANLASADFSSSRLVGATLVGAELNGANLNGVNLLGARLLFDELTEVDFQLDRAVEELNELQRGQILVDTLLDGITFDAQTVWPSPSVDEEMAAVTALVDSETTLTNTIKVGVLHSLSGPMAISEVAVRDAVLLAINQINQNGGVLGSPLEAIVEDGASEPEVFAEKARKLLEDDQVAVVFGGWTSDSRQAMLPVFEELNGLLFYPIQYEGFEASPNIFYLGPDPSQQLIPAVNYLLDQGFVNILLIGSEFAYSQTAHAIIKVRMTEAGHAIVGELYVPLGATEFGALIEQLRASPPDAIINTMYGESNQAFFEQFAEAPFSANDLPVLSTSVAEEEVRIIGPELLQGHLASWDYFQTLQTPENFAFVTAYKEFYGQERVTSSPIQNAFTAVYLWKTLVELADSTAVDAVRTAASEELDYIAPYGPVQVDPATQHLYKTARVGIFRDDGLIEQIAGTEDALPPDPFLTQFPWAEDVQEIIASFASNGETP